MLELEDISIKARLYLGLASWELGNGNAARAILQEIMKDYGKVKMLYKIPKNIMLAINKLINGYWDDKIKSSN